MNRWYRRCILQRISLVLSPALNIYAINRILNFDVQVIDEKDWPERSLTYACRTFDQRQKGETYLDVKPVRHIGFLDYDLKDFTPEFYATYQLLNVKNHEIYSSKFALSVVNSNQIELATEEDRKYGIDHWARLFKTTTWEAIKKWHKKTIAKHETIIAENEATIARKEAIIAEKEAAIVVKEALIAEKDEVLAEKDAEITRLKVLLTGKQS